MFGHTKDTQVQLVQAKGIDFVYKTLQLESSKERQPGIAFTGNDYKIRNFGVNLVCVSKFSVFRCFLSIQYLFTPAPGMWDAAR